ncbi:MAG TPA: GNAT family N-acetyltransferase [Pyrinomonadaceae bacterium]|nr:GNAT family N-acetyltransferase [Pyrinomonadaceae bacterium]
MSVTVRRAELEDAGTIAKFALRLFAQHREYDRERFADLGNLGGAERYYGSRAAAEEAIVLVAEVSGEVIGFVYAEFEELNYAELLESAVWVHDLFIDETTRRTGAGKALIDAAGEIAKHMGADKLVLHVAAKNEFAKSFFEGQGFRETMVEMTLGLNG